MLTLRSWGMFVIGSALVFTSSVFVACSDPPPIITNNDGGGGSSGGNGGEGGEGGDGGMAGSVNGGSGGTAGAGGCTGASDCDDGYACTADECQNGVCSHLFDIFSSCMPEQYCDWVQNTCLDNPACESDLDCVGAFDGFLCAGAVFCDLAVHKCHFLLLDDDLDGHASMLCGGDDCDDNDQQEHPGGSEVCDGRDNDCNGQIDDGLGIDFTKPANCGTCGNNCYMILLNADPVGIGCDVNGVPPGMPGTCTCTGCVAGWYDLNNDCICEYPCVKTANDDTLCNNKDDDCDGSKDEDVNKCTSITDCGSCGNSCVVLHGTPQCVHDGLMPCTLVNTSCKIMQCDSGWWDIDKSYATGCEYACTLSNGGIEACQDGIDNDCDGQIDEGC